MDHNILINTHPEMLAIFINGSLEAAALSIANSINGDKALQDAKSTLDMLLDSLKIKE
ncbi:hypothetical protein [Proteus myxofaciens]